MKKGHGYERALSSIHLRCVYLKRLGEGKGHYRTRQSLPMYIGIYLKINNKTRVGSFICGIYKSNSSNSEQNEKILSLPYLHIPNRLMPECEGLNLQVFPKPSLAPSPLIVVWQ